MSQKRLEDIARGNLVSPAEVRSLAAEVAALRIADVDRPHLVRAAAALRNRGDTTAAAVIERLVQVR